MARLAPLEYQELLLTLEEEARQKILAKTRRLRQVYVPGWQTEERRFRAGETLYTPAGSHLPENLSGHPIDVIIVELKG